MNFRICPSIGVMTNQPLPITSQVYRRFFLKVSRNFVRSVRALREKIKNNPQLDRDIGAFIGQESHAL